MHRQKWLSVILISFAMILATFLSFQYWLNLRAKDAFDHIADRLAPYAKIDYAGVRANIFRAPSGVSARGRGSWSGSTMRSAWSHESGALPHKVNGPTTPCT